MTPLSLPAALVILALVFLGGHRLGGWLADGIEWLRLRYHQRAAAKFERDFGEPFNCDEHMPAPGSPMPTRAELLQIAVTLAAARTCHDRRCVGFGCHRCHNLDCKQHRSAA